MSQHWTIDDFMGEMGHLDQLSITSPDSQVLHAMTHALIARIRGAAHWTSAGIMSMLEKANSMQDSNIKQTLKEAIETLNTSAGGHLRLTSSGQRVIDFIPYLTSEDWEVMSHGVQGDSMSMLARRMRSMGITSAKECLVRQAIALMLWQNHALGKPMVSPSAIHDMVEDFKTILHATTLPESHGEGHHTYPADPKTMGSAWLQKTYGRGSPACRSIQLAHWSKAIPMRSTSSLLKPKNHGQSHAVPSAQPGPSWGNGPSWGAMVELLQKWGPPNPSGQPHALQDVHFMPPGQSHAQTHALQTHGSHDRAIATPARAPMSASEMQEEPCAESMQKSREKEGPSSGSMQKSMEEEKPSAGSKQKDMGQGEPSAPAKSMEEWEEETFQALSRNHKKSMKGKAKTQAMKPHGKAASAKPSPKAKAKAKGKAKAKAKTNNHAAAVYGCPRCRGILTGCPTCRSSSYDGIRLPGRDAWKAHMKAMGKPIK